VADAAKQGATRDAVLSRLTAVTKVRGAPLLHSSTGRPRFAGKRCGPVSMRPGTRAQRRGSA